MQCDCCHSVALLKLKWHFPSLHAASLSSISHCRLLCTMKYLMEQLGFRFSFFIVIIVCLFSFDSVTFDRTAVIETPMKHADILPYDEAIMSSVLIWAVSLSSVHLKEASSRHEFYKETSSASFYYDNPCHYSTL